MFIYYTMANIAYSKTKVSIICYMEDLRYRDDGYFLTFFVSGKIVLINFYIYMTNFELCLY